MKCIVVTGGVLSGLGKGVVTASVGRILKDRGYSILPVKIDGYVNVDPGTMNPYEHGEVYVLDDGSETDLDLGHYERFLNVDLTGASNMTTGGVYKTVIEKERRGDYLGKTVQVIPHITEEIKNRIRYFKDADIVILEVGGTVGDIENRVFIEALRQMSREPKNDFLFIHLSYVPIILSGEQKTKPTQHSVKELLSLGIQPDVLIGRCDHELLPETRRKIGLFCGVRPDYVLSNPTIDDIYLLPLVLKKQNIGSIIVKELGLETHSPFTSKWDLHVEGIHKTREDVTVGIVGKYTGLEDAYLSIKEAFKHAGAANQAKVNLTWLESEEMRQDELSELDGLLVPGGFGSRGAEGKIKAIKHARETNLPFLGICFGMQLAVVEYARNVCGLDGANSSEVDENTKHPVIDLIPEQKDIMKKGGTMRLGAYPCIVKDKTLAHKLYGKDEISERHRHRWEVNPQYIETIEDKGMVFSGKFPNKNLMEICEIPQHRYFIASQFHPEFKSRLENPAPLFRGLVKAAIERQIAGE